MVTKFINFINEISIAVSQCNSAPKNVDMISSLRDSCRSNADYRGSISILKCAERGGLLHGLS